MQTHKTSSSDQTQKVAEHLSHRFKDGGVIALSGELGAGKTTFVQGFAKALGIKEKIISPTFLIIRQYKIPDTKAFFYHIDLYRLTEVDPINLGLEEILEDPNNIVLIEWAEKIKNQIKYSMKINIKTLDRNVREIQIS